MIRFPITKSAVITVIFSNIIIYDTEPISYAILIYRNNDTDTLSLLHSLIKEKYMR